MAMSRCLIVLVLLLAGACSRTPDDQAIRAAIERGALAVQEHDAGGLMDLVSEDFIGNDELDRAQLRNYLRAQFIAAQALGVHVGPIEVEVRGDRATARFDALFTDTSGRWIPDRATTLRFETGWRRSGKHWQCINARWSGDAER